jgi:hypothetical protein
MRVQYKADHEFKFSDEASLVSGDLEEIQSLVSYFT